MRFAIAIENDLAQELCHFKQKESFDARLIEQVLHYYKSYPIFTKEYLKRYYDKTTLSKIFASYSAIAFDSSIEELSKYTSYKIILSKNKNDFPYVSINQDRIENNLSATFSKQENRLKAKEHFKALFEQAKHIFIYDNYLYKPNVWKEFKNFIQECFPKKELNIFYSQDSKLEAQHCKEVKELHSQYSFKIDRNYRVFEKLHDRYIIVDNQVQIILTSGFEHLMQKDKDFTYIIRFVN